MLSRILVPLDESTMAEQALGPAIAIAAASGGHLDLVLVHAGTAYESLLKGSTASDPDESVYIHAMAREVERRTGVPADSTVIGGIPAEMICQHAARTGADLIVMTSHGRTGFSRSWLGSVADGVVRGAPAPVLMLRPEAGISWKEGPARLFKRVLVPLDGSSLASAILDPALELARWLGALPILTRVVLPVTFFLSDGGVPISPTSVVDTEATQLAADTARDWLSDLAQSVEHAHHIRVETEVVVAEHVAAAILGVSLSRHADLIAMSTHARGASRLLLGSVTDKVVRGSELPLLLLHPHRPGAAVVPPVIDKVTVSI